MADLNLTNLAGTVLGLVLSISVFSYLLGDNVLFRVTSSILIGVAAGIACVMTLYNVLLPQLVTPLLSNSKTDMVLVVVPLILSVMLLLKISPSSSRFGNAPVAYLVGVGVAAAIGGAVNGTIFPQINATINMFQTNPMTTQFGTRFIQIFEGFVVLIGTIATLAYFHYGTRRDQDQRLNRNPMVELLSWVGLVFIAITFGVLFAGVFSAALAAFVEKGHYFWDLLGNLFV
jgi:hypothetical protein